jgi:hypothetical protein
MKKINIVRLVFTKNFFSIFVPRSINKGGTII